jgi:hypothetical protein
MFGSAVGAAKEDLKKFHNEIHNVYPSLNTGVPDTWGT